MQVVSYVLLVVVISLCFTESRHSLLSGCVNTGTTAGRVAALVLVAVALGTGFTPDSYSVVSVGIPRCFCIGSGAAVSTTRSEYRHILSCVYACIRST